MPPKQKKSADSDKELVWAWCRSSDPENIERDHIESVYRLNSGTFQSDKQNSTESNRTQSIKKCLPGRSTSHASDQLYSSYQHLQCKRNCSNNAFCLSALGFEKWSSGMMDYDWSSDDESDSLDKRNPGIPVGLVNLGATCYVNVFLQLWYHTLAFRNSVFEWQTDNDGSLDMFGSLQYIFGLLELSERSSVNPSSLIDSLGLDTSQQQDAQEFGKLFVDLLPQPIKNLFSGSYDYITRCSACHYESHTTSQFNELDLNLEGHDTLEKSLKSFLKVEKLTGDNQYFCSRCQRKQDATRRIKLQKLPPVLNMQLLRFVFDRKTGHKKKLNTCLQFPDYLDLTDQVKKSTDVMEYELTAVLMHSGVTAYSGHYTAHIRIKDHWYSFDDTKVIKLKGKRLNLANEKSIDYDPESLSNNNECRKKGNRSKNAYMLVYQRKSFIESTKDLQPSRVPDKVKQKVIQDNINMSEKDHQTEIKQTEEMMKVEMKKEQLLEFWKDLPVSDPVNEDYYFIPTSWLIQTLKDWDGIKPIQTAQLLCRHSKLSWTLYNKVKAVSHNKGEFLYKTYRDDNTTPLSRDSSLCYKCIRNQVTWRQFKSKTEVDQKIITDMMKSNNNPLPNGSSLYWITKSDLKRWRSLVLKPLEVKAQVLDKPSKSDCTEESEVNSSETLSQDNAAEKLENGETTARFNAELLCSHGNMDATNKYRQLIPAAVWDILLKYFPDAVTFNDKDEPCKLCQDISQELEKLDEQRKTIVKEEKQLLSDLAGLRNRPILTAMTTDHVYGLSMECYKMWKSFLRNANSTSSLQKIDNCDVICPHNKLCVRPSDTDSLVLLWPYEWDILSHHFPYNHVITIQSQQNPTKPESLNETTPEFCSSCYQSRVELLNLESHYFENARIYVRLLEDESGMSSSPLNQSGMSSSPLNQSTSSINSQPAGNSSNLDETLTDETNTEPGVKKVKLDPLINLSSVRRSARKKHARGDKLIRMSSNATLQQLCIEITKLFAIAPFDQKLILDGRKLEGSDKTLAELQLYPECVLLLQGEMYDENYSEQALLEHGIIEEGFRGTGLANL